MPTGYTHPVQTGKVTDFRTFALQCARAMGALIMMRDESHDAPIPDEFEPSGYHPEAIKKVGAELVGLRSMTHEQIREAHRTAWEESVAHHDEYRERKVLEESRYRAMLSKVEDWEPPTDEHDGLKKFMREQLEGSIDHDCGDYLPALIEASADKWWQQLVKAAEKDLAYHKRENEKDAERTEGRNLWVRDLRESLKGDG